MSINYKLWLSFYVNGCLLSQKGTSGSCINGRVIYGSYLLKAVSKAYQ